MLPKIIQTTLLVVTLGGLFLYTYVMSLAEAFGSANGKSILTPAYNTALIICSFLIIASTLIVYTSPSWLFSDTNKVGRTILIAALTLFFGLVPIITQAISSAIIQAKAEEEKVETSASHVENAKKRIIENRPFTAQEGYEFVRNNDLKSPERQALLKDLLDKRIINPNLKSETYSGYTSLCKLYLKENVYFPEITEALRLYCKDISPEALLIDAERRYAQKDTYSGDEAVDFILALDELDASKRKEALPLLEKLLTEKILDPHLKRGDGKYSGVCDIANDLAKEDAVNPSDYYLETLKSWREVNTILKPYCK